MARTTAALVQAILDAGGNYRCGISLTPFINTASRIVTRVVACAAAKGVTIDTETAKDMESWYAAHVYTRSDPTYKSRSTLRASGSMNTDGTEFLTQALALDPSGCLATIISTMDSKFASGVWLGRRPSQQTDYADRN